MSEVGKLALIGLVYGGKSALKELGCATVLRP